jgi:hypothetical protein
VYCLVVVSALLLLCIHSLCEALPTITLIRRVEHPSVCFYNLVKKCEAHVESLHIIFLDFISIARSSRNIQSHHHRHP